MRTWIIGLLMTFSVGVYAQIPPQDQGSAEIYRIELLSPWEDQDGKAIYNKQIANRNCVDLVKMTHRCWRGPTIDYGTRIGVNLDIFQISSPGSQTRMIDLGEYTWADEVAVPRIEPWPKLKPGEIRHISFNASGADGKDGEPGRNADGTIPYVRPTVKREGFADKPVDKQVSSSIVTESGQAITDDYKPLVQAKEGHMYAVRVFDDIHDFYLLLRIDEIEQGRKVQVSIKKIDAPKDPNH
ncbi:MAG TPA: hypothetical protein VK918_08645 [Pyrinomonadaceae bacterium]|nr:hypothetical protein [Pyrinomonadaceae bacterium]